jgi:hypothetical protein
VKNTRGGSASISKVRVSLKITGLRLLLNRCQNGLSNKTRFVSIIWLEMLGILGTGRRITQALRLRVAQVEVISLKLMKQGTPRKIGGKQALQTGTELERHRRLSLPRKHSSTVRRKRKDRLATLLPPSPLQTKRRSRWWRRERQSLRR